MRLVESVADPQGRFLACVLASTARTEIKIVSFESEEFKSSIEFDSDTEIERVKWLRNENTGYLGVLLSNNEILVYSPLAKEVINKISTGFALSDFTDGPGVDVWGYDKKNMTLRKFGLFENRIVDSRPWATDKQCQYLQFLESNLAIASSALYIIDPYKIQESQQDVKIPAPKSHQASITNVVQCKSNTDLLAVSRAEDSLVQIVSVASSKVLLTLKCLSAAVSITLLEPLSLAVVTEDGTIEIFADVFGKKARKQVGSNLQLKTNTGVKFVNLVAKDSHFIGSWFDGYEANFTEFEVENLAQDGEITIDVGEENESESDVEMDDEENPTEEEEDTEYHRDEVSEVHALIVENLADVELLATILSQNQESAKSTMFLLKDQESLDLFRSLALVLSDDGQKSQGLGNWLKWLLISKGGLISKDPESVALLKLLQAMLNENSRILPNLLALQGRLALLQSQLKLRNDIMSKKDTGAQNDVSFAESSVFLDGENDDYEFEEEAEDDKSDDEDED